jgi:hypothetical protein
VLAKIGNRFRRDSKAFAEEHDIPILHSRSRIVLVGTTARSIMSGPSSTDPSASLVFPSFRGYGYHDGDHAVTS